MNEFIKLSSHQLFRFKACYIFNDTADIRKSSLDIELINHIVYVFHILSIVFKLVFQVLLDLFPIGKFGFQCL